MVTCDLRFETDFGPILAKYRYLASCAAVKFDTYLTDVNYTCVLAPKRHTDKRLHGPVLVSESSLLQKQMNCL